MSRDYYLHQQGDCGDTCPVCAQECSACGQWLTHCVCPQLPLEETP